MQLVNFSCMHETSKFIDEHLPQPSCMYRVQPYLTLLFSKLQAFFQNEHKKHIKNQDQTTFHLLF